MIGLFGHQKFACSAAFYLAIVSYCLSCHFAWTSPIGETSSSKLPFQLDTLIFKNDTHWTFWLNGIRMDPHFDVQKWLGQRGFCLIKVKETGIVIGSLEDPSLILFLEPRRRQEPSVRDKEASPKKTAERDEEGDLGF